MLQNTRRLPPREQFLGDGDTQPAVVFKVVFAELGQEELEITNNFAEAMFPITLYQQIVVLFNFVVFVQN